METGTSTMKGFTKDGKFRPTEKRFKPSLKKDDVKSFEDVHAEHMINQANAQKILLRHKENLEPDLQQCTLCDQEFDKNDSLYDVRVSRHIQGMHSKDRVIYSERTGSPSTPMGNHTYGDAKFVPVKEKRNKSSLSSKDIRKCPDCNRDMKYSYGFYHHKSDVDLNKCKAGK